MNLHPASTRRSSCTLRRLLCALSLITITAAGASLKVSLHPGNEAGGLDVLTGSSAAGDFRAASKWASSHWNSAKPALPFSFTYDNAHSAELLDSWQSTSSTRKLSATKTGRTLVWTDPITKLAVRCVLVEYQDFPAVEWTVYFKNTGTTPTPILANIQALDADFQRERDGDFVLHGIKGDSCTPDSYQPYELTLVPNSHYRFIPVGGRPTNGQFPYYNLRMPDGGVLLAVGWPGQWAASFTRDAANGLRIVAGQELTRLTLQPGEEIRTPLIAMLFWQGDDPLRAQNLWRSWMLAHNLPRTADEKPPAPIYIFCSGGFFPGLKVSETSEKQFIDILTRERIKIDYWWMDAGWYPCGEEWVNTGTWEPDQTRFPNGLRAVSEYAHAKGFKLITWFEPERVGDPNSWLGKNHPEWMLNGRLLNLGNPAAVKWLTDHVDRIIREQGIDLYRQDFNMDPLDCWRGHDAPDRQGITENLHVQGYLAYWDELRRRHPGMLIDSCASGGRRNDLETMRRAVPLLRSDYQAFDGNPAYATGNQGHTYGLSLWLPYYGHGVYQSAQDLTYYVRSHLCPSFGFCVDVRKPGIDWELYRRLVDQWRQVAPCMLGDYYPLTDYSLGLDQWIAWQFDRPEQGDGVVQAFRHAQAEAPTKTFRLRGLNPAAQYQLTDVDVTGSTQASGQQLMSEGLTVQLPKAPGASVITYRVAK
jgi:alpha-galactosidase